MDKQKASHHSLTGFWTGFFAKTPQGWFNFSHSWSSFAMRPGSKKKLAKQVLSSLSGKKKVRVSQEISISISELSSESLPAVFFTKTGQNPVLIKDRYSEGFLIQLWDGRESICGQNRLEKKVEPEGYFPTDRSEETARSLERRVPLGLAKKELGHLALGFGNGILISALLLLFVFAIFQIYQDTFPIAPIESTGLAFIGLIASLLATFGFLQFRSLISRWFENRSRSIRAKQQRLPAPFSIKSLVGVESGRQIIELVFAPFLLAAAVFAAWTEPVAVASWVIVIGLTIPSALFLAGLPRLLAKWAKARCPVEKISPPPVSDSAAESEIEEQSAPPVIQTQNLFLEHPDEKRVPLIDGISLKIEEGERVGFLGKTNTGIAILFQVLTGLLAADRGVAWIKGKLVGGNEAASGFGWFSEKSSLIAGTLRENICLGASREISDQELNTIAELTGLNQIDFCKHQGLDTPLSESGREISDHDRIRILLTRSLIDQPDTLIFQAPQDTDHDAAFQQILTRYLQSKDCTLLLGAKRSEQLEATDRTINFSEGKVIADGPSELRIRSEDFPITKQ